MGLASFTSVELETLWQILIGVLDEYRLFAGVTSEENRAQYEACHAMHEKVWQEIKDRGVKVTVCTKWVSLRRKDVHW